MLNPSMQSWSYEYLRSGQHGNSRGTAQDWSWHLCVRNNHDLNQRNSVALVVCCNAVLFLFLTPFSVGRAVSCLDCHVAKLGTYVARSGSRKGSAGSATSTTSLRVGCPSLPGCAGACHVPPRRVDARARCGAQLENPHQLPWRQRALRGELAATASEQGGGGGRGARMPHRPPTCSCCGPGRASSGHCTSLRRRATSIAAPSRSWLPGCGLPSARKGHTSVTSQSCASLALIGWDPRHGSVHKPLLGGRRRARSISGGASVLPA